MLSLLKKILEDHTSQQKIFLTGTVPTPSGLYHGTVTGHSTSWLGKKFNAAEAGGINIFKTANSIKEMYPFKTASQKSSADKNQPVLAIDYNLRDNPFWLRPVLDEVVEIAPGKLLGKLQLRFPLGFVYTVLYFNLTQ